MMVVSLLFTFLEHFKVVYPNMCWYVFMTSLDVVNSLANLLTLRNMRHVHFCAIVSSDGIGLFVVAPICHISTRSVLVAVKAWEDIIFSELIWIKNSMKKWREWF